jgi:hypothetical protein
MPTAIKIEATTAITTTTAEATAIAMATFLLYLRQTQGGC